MARPEIDPIQLEIVQMCLMSESGLLEPDIRSLIKGKLQITALKTAKTHLERLELTGILNKEMMKGKSNLWKINPKSPKILPFFIEILSKEDKAEVTEFYNSQGVQKYLCGLNWMKWLTKLEEFVTQSPNPYLKYDHWMTTIQEAINLSPTLLLAIISPNLCHLLLSVLITENWPSNNEIFAEMPIEDGEEIETLYVKTDLRTEVSINAYLFAGLIIDYYKFPLNRDKITSYIYHLSMKYPVYQGDKLLSVFVKGLEKYQSSFKLMDGRGCFGDYFP
jgi:hypothetical protein